MESRAVGMDDMNKSPPRGGGNIAEWIYYKEDNEPCQETEANI